MTKKKFVLTLMLICFMVIAIKQGLKTVLMVIFAVTVAGTAVIAPLWLVAFIIALVVDKNFKKALEELNPLRMIKECIIDSEW